MTFTPGFLRSAMAMGVALLVCGAVIGAEKDFRDLVSRLQKEKPSFAERQQKLLNQRYDLADRPAKGVTMARGKPVQAGVRAKLPAGTTWERLAGMTPEDIKDRNLWPAGFYPLPHPHHEAGGMIFPKVLIDETKRQTDRDLTRFDLDFDLPQHFLPEFPRADLSHHAARPGRRVAREAGDARQLHRVVQRYPQSQATRRLAVAGHAVPAAAVQRHGRPPDVEGPHRRGLLRLPRQRPHDRGHAHRRRYPSRLASPSHRHAVAARRQHPAAVRLAAGHEERRGFHGVRAAGRLLRRRPGPGAEERRQHPGTRQPGALHGGVSGYARLSARAEAQRAGQARSGQGHRERAARPGVVLRQGPMRRRATRRRTTPTTRCTTCRSSGSSSRN